jgi:hypothetical protein
VFIAVAVVSEYEDTWKKNEPNRCEGGTVAGVCFKEAKGAVNYVKYDKSK